MRILITGGCGYVGSRLIRDLATDARFGGSLVRIMDNLSSGSARALMGLPPEGRYEFIEADLLDAGALRLALKDVDAVVHLAAVVTTPITFDTRPTIQQVNHWGTEHLVEACLRAEVRRFVFASSAAVYGVGGPFTEEDGCQPLGFYAQSKLAAERAVVAAGDRGMMSAVLRLGSVYGLAPVMRYDTVANRFAYLAGVGRALPVFGSGEQRRPLVHVRGASAALRMALDPGRGMAGRVLNVVADNPSVLELAEVLKSQRPGTRIRFTEQEVMTHLSVEVDGTAIRALGWAPELSVGEGLKELADEFGLVVPVGGVEVDG